MLSSLLKFVMHEQKAVAPERPLVTRSVYGELCNRHHDPTIVIVSGIRRAGKSTLLYQLRQTFPGHYLNFDDERLLHYAVDDFQQTDELFHQLNGDLNCYYFDEIQNVQGWERFVRRLHDQGKKIYITGSNAHLMSRELGTHLTGRYRQITLFPFSFPEYLTFQSIDFSEPARHMTSGRSKIMDAFNLYLKNGGFPEYLRNENRDYHKFLYESILYRDIIVRHGIRNERAVKELMLFIFSNVGKSVSYNRLTDTLGVKNASTVSDFFSYLEESYLVMLCRKFSYSARSTIRANKKIYTIDTGLARSLGYRLSDDYGRLLENSVYLALKSRGREIYYFTEKNECDFVTREGAGIREAIQVCYELTDDNRVRETNGLLEALTAFDIAEGYILTLSQEDEITIQDKHVHILPVWKWLLEKGITE